MNNTLNPVHALLTQLYNEHSRRMYATLVRLLGDMDAAEEALQEAFHIALTQWQEAGVPDNPRSWLISTAKFKAIDQFRRQRRFADIVAELDIEEACEPQLDGNEIADDQLRLIFACCHPALDPKVQVPLTLREVCGLTTEAIASAFIVAPSAMAQRIVRGKAKIKAAKIPFEIPSTSELPRRLDSVLTVIYLIFNEGYNASSGDLLIRTDLTSEAIRLARLLCQLIPDAEALGLLALMLISDSRKCARIDLQGNLVTLEHQDRSLWLHDSIAEGYRLIQQAMASGDYGYYTLQAAISATHAAAGAWEQTDWPQIVALYDALLGIESSPVIALNRAVAVGMRDGAEQGLKALLSLASERSLDTYHLYHAALGEFYWQLGDVNLAHDAFLQALALTQQTVERRHLEVKIARCEKK